MSLYTFRVLETVQIEKEYTVRAKYLPEAREMAAKGETIKETRVKDHGVIGRAIIDDHISHAIKAQEKR